MVVHIRVSILLVSQELYGELAFDGLKVDVMHSDRTKQQRYARHGMYHVPLLRMVSCAHLHPRTFRWCSGTS